MPLVLADRVRETTTTTGTGTISLAGPVSGFQGFGTAIGNANTTYYTIVDAATGAWEVGLGTYTSSGSTLARTTVLSSSNSDALVPFGAGTKDVFVTQPAERAVYVLGAGTGLAAGAAAFTANGVPYADSTSTLATSSNLTFNGTTLTANALTTTSTVTINGGTANGVAYLNGSKVLTTGSALTFDGTVLTASASASTTGNFKSTSSAAQVFNITASNDANTTIGMGVQGSASGAIGMIGSAQPFFGTSAAELNIYNNNASGAIKFGLGTGVTEQMRLTSTGLGIGTSSPGAKLDVQTSAQQIANLASSNVAGGYITLGRTGATALFGSYNATSGGGSTINADALFFRNANGIGFGSGGAAVTAFLDSSGNLGIGTSSPVAKLQSTGGVLVSGAAAAFTANAGVLDYFGGYTRLIAVGANTSTQGAFNFATSSSDASVFNSRMVLDSSGNLGIGTSSPFSNAAYNSLTVGGAKRGILTLNNASGTNVCQMFVDSADLTNLYSTTSIVLGSASGANLLTYNSSGNLGLGVTPSASWSGQSALQVNTRSAFAGSSNFTAVSTNAIATSNGWAANYLANGTAALYTQSVSTSAHAWYTAPSGTAGTNISFTQAMTLDASGNLLVGATSAVGRFTLQDTGTTTEITLRSAGGVGNNNRARIIGGYEAGGSDYGGYLAFNTTTSANVNTERARIDSSGNLGIGTSSPANRVQSRRDATTDASNSQFISENRTGAAGQYALYGTRLDNGSGSGFTPVAFGAVQTDAAGRKADFVIAVSDTDNIDLSTDIRLRLDSSGNLGLGVTPSAWSTSEYKAVQIGNGASFYGRVASGDQDKAGFSANAFWDQTDNRWEYIATDSASRYDQIGGGHFWFTAPSGTAGNAITFTQAMTLDASGNLGVGTTSPTSTYSRNVQIDGSASAGIRFTSTSYTAGFDVVLSAGDAYLLNRNNTALIFGTNGTERARITSGGDLLVGTTSGAFTGKVVALQATSASDVITAWNSATTGDNVFVGFFTDGGAGRGSIDYNRAGGLVRYNTTSDYRAKDIIGPITNSGATIDALKVYEGVMKGATQSRPMLVAHEAQAVAPYAVSGVKDEVNEDGTPKFQQMDVSSLVPLLLAELQSLRRRVAQLEGNQP